MNIPDPDSSLILHPGDRLILVYREALTADRAFHIQEQLKGMGMDGVIVVSAAHAFVQRREEVDA